MADMTDSLPVTANVLNQQQETSSSDADKNDSFLDAKTLAQPVVNRKPDRLSSSGRKRYGMMEFDGLNVEDSLLLHVDPLLVLPSCSAERDVERSSLISDTFTKNERADSKDNSESIRSPDLLLGIKETNLTNSFSTVGYSGKVTSYDHESQIEVEPMSSISEVRDQGDVNHKKTEKTSRNDEMDANTTCGKQKLRPNEER